MEQTKVQLSEKARELKAKYLREWRQKNPGKNAQYCADYWERKAQQAEKEPVTQ